MAWQCNQDGGKYAWRQSSSSWSLQKQDPGTAQWACKLCHQANPLKSKACKGCNARRVFADANSAAEADNGAGRTGKHVQAKQNPVAQLIQEATNTGQPTMPSQINQDQPSMVDAPPTRKDLEEKIRTLEAHLKNLPSGALYEGIRKQFVQEISDAKTRINAAKPAGLRLESCRQALKRAEDRCAEADQRLKAMMIAKEAACQEVERLKKEATEIELELSGNSGSSSLGSLHDGMARVLSEMATSATVAPETVQNAKERMEKLFRDLTTLAGACQQQMSQQHAAQQAQHAAAVAFAHQQAWAQQRAMGQQHWIPGGVGAMCTPSANLGIATSPAHVMVPSVAQQLHHGVAAARALHPQFDAATIPVPFATPGARSRSPPPRTGDPNGEGGVAQ